MPEFILDHGTAAAAQRFKALDEFTQGYIEAMFFTSTGTGDDEDLEHATVAELAAETLDRIIADCAAFQSANAALLDSVYGVQGKYEREPYDAVKAGRDYWYTRNGHGTGFWDRGLGEVGDKLTTIARCSELNLYRGDDGRLYLM